MYIEMSDLRLFVVNNVIFICSFSQQGGYPNERDRYASPHDSQRSLNNGPLYSGSPYGERLNDLPSDRDNVRPLDDGYRSTPPIDDPYHNPANDSYNRLPNMDSFKFRPQRDNDSYRATPPLSEERFQGDSDRYPPDQYSDREPSESGRYALPKDDDPYGDARPPPGGGRYGQPFLDSGRPIRTPSPGSGSDRAGKL